MQNTPILDVIERFLNPILGKVYPCILRILHESGQSCYSN